MDGNILVWNTLTHSLIKYVFTKKCNISPQFVSILAIVIMYAHLSTMDKSYLRFIFACHLTLHSTFDQTSIIVCHSNEYNFPFFFFENPWLHGYHARLYQKLDVRTSMRFLGFLIITFFAILDTFYQIIANSRAKSYFTIMFHTLFQTSLGHIPSLQNSYYSTFTILATNYQIIN
jgi:hypothetical protein